jgi:HTH-type transcriptional repressor of NAD biosynthesis genes
VQDGTRLNETYRNLLDASHRKILKQHQIAFVEITGSWEERFEKAVEQIDLLIKDYKLRIKQMLPGS